MEVSSTYQLCEVGCWLKGGSEVVLVGTLSAHHVVEVSLTWFCSRSDFGAFIITEH